MDSFVVSARKYRPSDFHSVVGQLSITTTLKNALKNKQLAQAFLFCGPRGVGKTTCARILAKTINCEHLTSEFEACNQCESCTSFNSGKSMSIYELDAASNNSVDNIRELVEQVYYAPQLGKYKVYIIDEVHMLSSSAFNAFLKTLEEPPAHAIFILATTEKHKILPTILSRCQIFEFKRIQISDISKHLKYIAGKENIHFEDEALHLIAQKADGALRDALSLFDQLCTFTGNNLTYQEVIENLNILDYEYYFNLTDAFLDGDISKCLLIFDEILQKGFDGHHFVEGLSEHFRNLMVASSTETLNLLEVGETIKQKYTNQKNRFSKELLLESLNIAAKTDIDYKNTKNQRLWVEIMLMNLCKLNTEIEKKKTQPLVIESTENNTTSPIINVQQPITENKTIPKEALEIKTEIKIEKKNASSAPGILSIHELLGGTKQSKENTELINTEVLVEKNTPFNQERLDLVWKEYANKVKEEGKEILFSIITNSPELQENNKIYITLQNSALLDEFNANKSELLSYLKETLNNTNLEIISSVKSIDVKGKLYTAKDKFEKMSELNPTILKLKDLFGLEIEM